jgi:ATP-dependent Clp protease adaptor protein ClpS
MPELDEQVITKEETRLKKPPLYKVLLHNDDFTTMEFVVYVLKTIFNHSDAAAFTIMMKVHNEGIGIAGIYTYEIAQMKVEKVKQIAEANEYPLLCTIEESE